MNLYCCTLLLTKFSSPLRQLTLELSGLGPADYDVELTAAKKLILQPLIQLSDDQ